MEAKKQFVSQKTKNSSNRKEKQSRTDNHQPQRVKKSLFRSLWSQDEGKTNSSRFQRLQRKVRKGFPKDVERNRKVENKRMDTEGFGQSSENIEERSKQRCWRPDK